MYLFIAETSRNELVREGALPVLVNSLHTADHDVQYYCAAALSNMAVKEKHRAMIVAIGHYAALRQLILFMKSRNEKVISHDTMFRIIYDVTTTEISPVIG